jgi:hypothetical protein
MHQRRLLRAQVLLIVLLLPISSLQTVRSLGLGMMLLRIRTNEGTFQIRGLDETITKVQDLVTAPPMHLYNLVEPGFSLDPLGKELLLDYDQPLSYYQLKHGSMIYVRVEKRMKLPAATTTATTTTITRDSDSIDPLSFYNSQLPSIASKPKPAGSSSTIAAAAAAAFDNRRKHKDQTVIDLLDSDSEDGGDSGDGQQSINLLESSDDDSVKIVQPTAAPPKKKSKVVIKNPYAKPKEKATTTATTTTTNAAKAKPRSARSSLIASSSSSLPDTFQVASYNVWFGPPDPAANQVHYIQRMKAIAQALLQRHQNPTTNPLLAIGFQELTPSLKQSLFPLFHQDYHVCSQPSLDAHGGSYGVGLALHKTACGAILESKFIPFSHSRQGRGILYARTSRGLLFCTTHLESYSGPQSDGSQERQAQLLEWQAFCQLQQQTSASNNNTPLTTVVLVGDLNWDDERARGGAAPNEPLLSLLDGHKNNDNDCCWKDAWKEAGSPKAHQYTYDAKENPMLGGNLRRRFDRCVWQSKSHTVSQLETIGRQALPNNLVWNKRNTFNGASKQVPVAPSDHFGMVVTFSKKK